MRLSYRKGDLITLALGKKAMVEEILPEGKYKVILPKVTELSKGYMTNVAIVKPVIQYFIEKYE